MAEPISVLQAINQKELEIERRIEDAHCRAETLIQAAREEAEQTLIRSAKEARAEAEALYRDEIEAAQKEADALVRKNQEQAAALRCQAKVKLADAAKQIVALVLPPSLNAEVERLNVERSLAKRE